VRLWFEAPESGPDPGKAYATEADALLEEIRRHSRNLRAVRHTLIEPYGEAVAKAVLCRLAERPIESARASDEFRDGLIFAFRGPGVFDLVLIEEDLAFLVEAKAARTWARYGGRINRSHNDLLVPAWARRMLAPSLEARGRTPAALRLGDRLLQGTQEYVEAVLEVMAQYGRRVDVNTRLSAAAERILGRLDHGRCLFVTVEAIYGPALTGAKPGIRATIESYE
jgi:hypothetical protein